MLLQWCMAAPRAIANMVAANDRFNSLSDAHRMVMRRPAEYSADRLRAPQVEYLCEIDVILLGTLTSYLSLSAIQAIVAALVRADACRQLQSIHIKRAQAALANCRLPSHCVPRSFAGEVP